MAVLNSTTSSSRPHWDGSRILFEVSYGDERISCAISLAALQEVGGKRCYKSAELLACFSAAYPRIEAAALAKLKTQSSGLAGRLNLWADDVEPDEPETAGAPVAPEGKRRRRA